MTTIRSIIFIIFLIIWTLLVGVLGSIVLPFKSQKMVAKIGYTWSYVLTIALRVICGVKVKVINAHNLPKEGCIIASKHQSVWETIYFVHYLKNPAFILKKELLNIPLYGWYLRLIEMIAIDRKGGASIVKQMSEAARKAFENDRPIVIFPEGTRVKDGQSVEYKSGIAALHKELPDIPIIPVALNSGKVWPAKSWIIKSGTIKVKFLEPITKTLSKDQLLKKLKEEIDSATNSL